MVELMPTKKTRSNRGSRDASAWAQLSASNIGGWGMVAVMSANLRRSVARAGRIRTSNPGRPLAELYVPSCYVLHPSGLFKEVDVLGSTNAAATIAVKDIAVARKFYEDKLGLELSGT